MAVSQKSLEEAFKQHRNGQSEDLLRELTKIVYCVPSIRGMLKEDIEELVSEMCLYVLENLDRVEKLPKMFSYLYTVIIRKAADFQEPHRQKTNALMNPSKFTGDLDNPEVLEATQLLTSTYHRPLHSSRKDTYIPRWHIYKGRIRLVSVFSLMKFCKARFPDNYMKVYRLLQKGCMFEDYSSKRIKPNTI